MKTVPFLDSLSSHEKELMISIISAHRMPFLRLALVLEGDQGRGRSRSFPLCRATRLRKGRMYAHCSERTSPFCCYVRSNVTERNSRWEYAAQWFESIDHACVSGEFHVPFPSGSTTLYPCSLKWSLAIFFEYTFVQKFVYLLWTAIIFYCSTAVNSPAYFKVHEGEHLCGMLEFEIKSHLCLGSC